MQRKTDDDPSGQRVNRVKTTRALIKRLVSSRRRVTDLFYRIPRQLKKITELAANKAVYDYDLTPEQSEFFNRQIQTALNDELLGEQRTEQMPTDWWFKKEIELAFRQGTLEETNQFNQMISAAILLGLIGRGGMPLQRIPIELLLTSQAYLAALNNAYVAEFTVIKTLAHDTADDLIRVINAGIKARKTPGEITQLIKERFDVSESSAKRIAVTEINKAYNDARLNATKIAAEQSGLRAAVIHISALMSTTRENHRARHGNAYTVEDQAAWWDEGANRINCHCTVRSVLIDRSGNVVQREDQSAIKDRGRDYFDS